MALAVLAWAVGAVPASATTPNGTGTLDLADPAVTQLSALAPDAGTGRVVAALGDVNGEGHRAFATATPRAVSGGRTGVVQVVFGRADASPVALNDLASGGFRING